jgi:hypothetical protein
MTLNNVQMFFTIAKQTCLKELNINPVWFECALCRQKAVTFVSRECVQIFTERAMSERENATLRIDGKQPAFFENSLK